LKIKKERRHGIIEEGNNLVGPGTYDNTYD
jgi:hypothetical protein